MAIERTPVSSVLSAPTPIAIFESPVVTEPFAFFPIAILLVPPLVIASPAASPILMMSEPAVVVVISPVTPMPEEVVSSI